MMREEDKSARQLVEEWQAGHNREENFKSLFDRYSSPLNYFFQKHGFSHEDCRDLTQQTLFDVYRGLSEFRLDSSFETWLFKIARNNEKNEFRNQSAGKRRGEEVSLDGAADDGSPSLVDRQLESELVVAGPLDGILVEEGVRFLRDAMQELPPNEQRCVLLWTQDLKYREIADVLKMPLGTVKSKLAKAKDHLKELLADRYPGHRSLVKLNGGTCERTP
ncbi:MAG: sigma-70 family RNA polymerase sigma factor [bacterium]|nr:sigma-70 family RNA polymerase sigma factor [bacterium]